MQSMPDTWGCDGSKLQWFWIVAVAKVSEVLRRDCPADYYVRATLTTTTFQLCAKTSDLHFNFTNSLLFLVPILVLLLLYSDVPVVK